MEKNPMKHEFDQVLSFMGGDMKNIFDFNAEVEIYLGEEQEKHIINRTCTIYVPKGLVHGPLNFKRIDKPILFMDMPLSKEYTKQVMEGNKWGETFKP